jgi:hypothetical protein
MAQRAISCELMKSSSGLILLTLCALPFALTNQHHIHIRHIRAGRSGNNQIIQ